MVSKLTQPKKDLIPLALYQIIHGKYEIQRALEKELVEHLESNYEFKKEHEQSWDFECMVSDSIYGEREDSEDFVKELKNMCVRK